MQCNTLIPTLSLKTILVPQSKTGPHSLWTHHQLTGANNSKENGIIITPTMARTVPILWRENPNPPKPMISGLVLLSVTSSHKVILYNFCKPIITLVTKHNRQIDYFSNSHVSHITSNIYHQSLDFNSHLYCTCFMNWISILIIHYPRIVASCYTTRQLWCLHKSGDVNYVVALGNQ